MEAILQETNAAFYFDPEGYTTAGPKLMGRQAAGEGFLRGFLRHAQVDAYYCFAPGRTAAQSFARLCEECAPAGRPVRCVTCEELSRPSETGTLFLPVPGLGAMAWRRRRVGPRQFSLCGVTHTIASHAAMDSLAELLAAPVEPWDALICTSRAVLDAVAKLLDG